MNIKLEKVELNLNNRLILNGVNLIINEPCLYGLLGKNGIGKTSLFKCSSGIYDDFLGSIMINNIDIKENKFEALKQIGSIIEYPIFYDDKTAIENIQIHSKFLRFKGDLDIKKCIEIVGLNPNEKIKVGKYSLGMKQKLGIARALSTNPDIILLDEPFNGLDPVATKELRNILNELKKEKIIILSSHAIDDIVKISDRCGVLSDGKLNEVDLSVNNIVDNIITMMQ